MPTRKTVKARKRTGFKARIALDFRSNYRIYFLLLSLLIISVAAGSFSAKSLPDEAKQNFANYLRGAIVALSDKPNAGDIILGFLPSILVFLCMAASSLHLAFLLLAFFALMSTGWTWGLTSAVISSSYGFKGVLFSVICIFFAQIIPTVCYFKIFCAGVHRSAKPKPKPPLKTLLGSLGGWGTLLLLSLITSQMVLPFFARLIMRTGLE